MSSDSDSLSYFPKTESLWLCWYVSVYSLGSSDAGFSLAVFVCVPLRPLGCRGAEISAPRGDSMRMEHQILSAHKQQDALLEVEQQGLCVYIMRESDKLMFAKST